LKGKDLSKIKYKDDAEESSEVVKTPNMKLENSALNTAQSSAIKREDKQ
jgi:hypothetical protein